MTTVEPFHFRLYIVGQAPNSIQARANLEELCRVHLADRYLIEIVDLAREPERALADGVYMTPTLVKIAPPPALNIVGNLSDTAPVLTALGLGF
jgi:circadian clock protein KaiB